jgi:hypothetical protein
MLTYGILVDQANKTKLCNRTVVAIISIDSAITPRAFAGNGLADQLTMIGLVLRNRFSKP